MDVSFPSSSPRSVPEDSEYDSSATGSCTTLTESSARSAFSVDSAKVGERKLVESDLLLARAAERGDTSSVKQILESAKVSSIDIAIGTLSRTPLHHAAGYGQTDVVLTLLEAGAAVGARDLKGRTGLHEACVGGHSDCLALLLRHGGTAHVDVADINGRTAAHLAAFHGETECLNMLCTAGCDACAEDASTRTAAHFAAMNNHSTALQCLMDRGIEVDCPDCDGRTPAHYAAERGALSCLRLLASSGVDMCVADHHGKQPAHLVAFADHLDCLKLLLKLGGAERTSRDENGRTLLHMAAKGGATHCLHWLLETGSSPTSLDYVAATPAHMAASAGCPQAFHCLQEHGANMQLRDHHGNTPLEAARLGGRVSAILRAVENKEQCPRCVDDAKHRAYQAAHKPTRIEAQLSKDQLSLFKSSQQVHWAKQGPASGKSASSSRSGASSKSKPIGQYKRDLAAMYYGRAVHNLH